MANTADLIVRIKTEGDTRNLDNAGSAAEKWGKRTAVAATALAAASGAVIAFGVSAVKSASRTQQAMGGIDSVFGKNASTIKAWAKDSAQSVGLATSEYGEFAALLGSQLKNMGLPMGQVTQKTGDLIKLGADLAATYGGTTADAVEALSAVFRGETDPIEKYGVTIKQADIQAQKAKMGAAGLTGAADKQATAMAALALVSNQTAAAHGKFAEESNTAAGQAQRASAEFENMKSSLGTALLPIVAAAAKMLGGLARAVGEHPKIAQAAAAAILVLTAALFGLIAVTKVYTTVQTLAAAASGAAWLAALGPILLVVVAVAAVIAVVVLLWKKSDAFRKAVIATWTAIRVAASASWNVIRAVGNAVFAVLNAYARTWLSLTRAAFNTARAVATAAFNGIRSAVGAVSSAINTLLGWIRRIKVPGAIEAAFSAIRRAVSAASSAVSSLISWLGRVHVPSLGSGFSALTSAINSAISAVKSLIGWLSRIKVPKIHLPKIPGLGRSAAVAPASGISPMSAGTMAAPRIAAPSARATSSTAAAPIVINVTGALDPEAVARQIRRVLAGHDRRIGLRT